MIKRLLQGLVRQRVRFPSKKTKLRFGGELKRIPEPRTRHKQSLRVHPCSSGENPSRENPNNHVERQRRKQLFPLLSTVTERFIMATQAGTFDSAMCDLTPPKDKVNEMKVLDRDAFQKETMVPGFTAPVRHIGEISKVFKDLLLKMPGIKPLAELEENHKQFSTHKLCLLDPKKLNGFDSLSENCKDALTKAGITEDCVKMYKLQLNFANWSYQEVLQAILPQESDGVAGFSIIGHIVHLNLREDVMDYKKIIGEVLLDKIPSAHTVVNKLNTIDNTYRNFQMELLAGEDDMVTVSKEHGLSFHLDFSKVYWNPRLGTEHKRIVDRLDRSDIVYDVFAGIGPFAVPAAKKGCTVFANDLNPESYRWLQHNLRVNKVRADYNTYNLDGREFIRTVVKQDLAKRQKALGTQRRSHVVMNLPALAIEFLDAFRGLMTEPLDAVLLPRVYCYGFSKAEDPLSDIRDRVESVLGGCLGPDADMRFVRNVAPGKDMTCAMFVMPQEVLVASGSSPPVKRQKTDSTDQVESASS